MVSNRTISGFIFWVLIQSGFTVYGIEQRLVASSDLKVNQKKIDRPTIRVQRGDFLFTLNPNPENDFHFWCDEKPFVRLAVHLISANKQIYDQIFCKPEKMKYLDFLKTFDFDDYNYDGFPDFRFTKDADLTQDNYFLYYEKGQTFTQDHLLSSGYDMSFNKESLTVEFEQRYAGFKIDTRMRGIGLSYVELQNVTTRSLRLNYQEGPFIYSDGVLFEAKFQFETNPQQRNPPADLYEFQRGGYLFQAELGYRYRINDPSSQQYGMLEYYRVLDTNNRLIFEFETPYLNGIRDTAIYTEDYNFDGHLDLKIWDQKRTQFVYYFFESKQGQFLEDSLVSSFQNLRFDPISKTLSIQSSDQFWIGQNPEIQRETFTLITYTLSGVGLQNFEIKTEVIDFQTWEKITTTKKYSYLNKRLTELAEE